MASAVMSGEEGIAGIGYIPEHGYHISDLV